MFEILILLYASYLPRVLQDLDAANGEEVDRSGTQDPDDAEESKDKEREKESAQEKDRASAEEAKEDTPQVKCPVVVQGGQSAAM
jgi:Sec-independent protein translocase protein TatA